MTSSSSSSSSANIALAAGLYQTECSIIRNVILPAIARLLDALHDDSKRIQSELLRYHHLQVHIENSEISAVGLADTGSNGGIIELYHVEKGSDRMLRFKTKPRHSPRQAFEYVLYDINQQEVVAQCDVHIHPSGGFQLDIVLRFHDDKHTIAYRYITGLLDELVVQYDIYRDAKNVHIVLGCDRDSRIVSSINRI